LAEPNPTSIDVKDLLEAASVGTFAASSGWGIWIGKQPAKPDTSITLFDDGGFAPDPKFLLDRPTLRVLVRGSEWGYTGAYSKAQAVKDTLLGDDRQTVGGTLYVGIIMTGDIAFIQYDDNNRPIFSLNFQIWREPSDATNRSAI
jgi:hypothetical protein